MKYLTLIRRDRAAASAPAADEDGGAWGRCFEYIEVTLDDIAIANRLAHEVLGRSLDELPPQTRRLLELIDALVTSGVREAAASTGRFFALAAEDPRAHAAGATRSSRCTSAGSSRWNTSSCIAARMAQGFVYELVVRRRRRRTARVSAGPRRRRRLGVTYDASGRGQMPGGRGAIGGGRVSVGATGRRGRPAVGVT